MGGRNLFGGLMPLVVDTAEEKERCYSRDSGTEEEFEILEQEEIKERRHSGDSGNTSQEGVGVNNSDTESSAVTTLEFQLTQYLLSQIKADEDNRGANSGKQAQLDLSRMNFVINTKIIDKECVLRLYGKNNRLISNGNEDYRTFAKQVFTGMFQYAEAEISNDNILEELITNCNQSGYQAFFIMQTHNILEKYGLLLRNSDKKIIDINCSDRNCVHVSYKSSIPICNSDDIEKEVCELDSSLEFTLKFQNGKVKYENGKVTLTIPEQLKNYKADGKSLLDDINRHFEDEDNRIIESLVENIGEGSKSFAVDLPAEVDSDSFDIIPEDTVFDLGHIPELVKKAVDDKDVNALANHIGFFQDHATHVSSKEGLPVVEKTLEIVSGFIEEQGKAWRCYPTVPVANHIYAINQQYCNGYISQADYEKAENLKKTLCKVKSDLIKRSSNSGSPVINAQDTSAILNETPTSSQVVSREQLNTKEFKNQQPQRNIVDKVENIMNNKKASVEEAIGNNYRRGKMHSSDQDIKTIEEMLIDAVDSINPDTMIDLLKKLDDSVYKSTLQKLLSQANDKMTSLGEGKQKEDLAQIIALLKNEFEHIDASSVGNDVEATASSQAVHVVEPESDLASSSSEDDDFSKLKSDDSARSSPSFEVIDETEAPKTAELEATAAMLSMATKEKSNNPNNDKDDQQNLTVPTVSSSLSENIGSNSASEAELLDDDEDDRDYYYNFDPDVDNDQKQDIQSEALASEFEIENVNNDITVNQSAEHVEKIANEDTLPELEIVATSALPEATANGTVSSNSVPCTSRVELTSDDEEEFLSIAIEDVNNGVNVNQPTGHVEQVANGNGQPKTELPRINEQSSKSGLKKNPQNTKKYVVAASALAITGIALGAAVAVYLEMLAVGIAVAACCLIAATVIYSYGPKSLVEGNEVEKVDDTQKSTPCCG